MKKIQYAKILQSLWHLLSENLKIAKQMTETMDKGITSTPFSQFFF